jgi:hypothetical protein
LTAVPVRAGAGRCADNMLEVSAMQRTPVPQIVAAALFIFDRRPRL